MTSFTIKNQKDKEHFFIFRIKKNECSTGKINIFKKFRRETPTYSDTPISRVLKRVKLAGVSQYPAWVLYIKSPSEIYMMNYTCNIREQLHSIINHKKKYNPWNKYYIYLKCTTICLKFWCISLLQIH
jgi:hypothetical protein